MIRTITVKYLGPTDTKGSRWVVTYRQDGEVRRRTVPFDYALGGGVPGAYGALIDALLEEGWDPAGVRPEDGYTAQVVLPTDWDRYVFVDPR